MPWIDDLPAEIADSLSQEIKENPTLAQYNSLEEALKGHIATKSLVGSSIRVPGPDAGDEDKQKFYDKLINAAPNLMMKPDFSEPEQASEFYNLFGKPGEAAQYQLPEGTDLDPTVESEIRELAYDANMNQEQFQKMIGGMSDRNKQLKENMQTQSNDDMKSLKGEWGMAFDDRTSAAKDMNERFYPGRPFDGLIAGELKALYSMSESMTGKGPQAATQIEAQVGRITPAEAMEQADEIMRRIHDPKSTMEHSEKMALINKRIKLLQDNVPKFAHDR